MKLSGWKISGAGKKTAHAVHSNGSARRHGKNGGLPKPMLALGIVMALLLVLIIGGCAIIGGSDRIYPNVIIAGENLGGKTKLEAAQALLDAGYESGVANVRATIVLSAADEVTVSAADAGMTPSTSGAAELAYAFGRDGGFFGRAAAYLKCLSKETELTVPAEFDRSVVRAATDKAAGEYNIRLAADTYEIGEREIRIVKGTHSALADPEAVYDLMVETLYEALSELAPVTREYELPEDIDTDSDIDLAAIYNSINVAPVSAAYVPETYSVTESVVGVSFDMDAAQRDMETADEGETIVIPLIFTEPDITKEALEAILFRDVLTERTTNIAGTYNRLNNIKLASAACDGKLLNPGETFSFNGTVGKRTAAKGYLEAGAYAGGKTVQEIGGGICQVSSTIYDCAVRANLLIVERANHMFPVAYLPYGNDATVNWGTIDFQFKNDTDYPIRLDVKVDGRKLTVRVVGTKMDPGYVKLTYEVTDRKDFTIVRMEDASVPDGKEVRDTPGHQGMTVVTYKNYYDGNDQLIKTEKITTSKYRAQNEIILVPIGALNPTPTPSEAPHTPPPTHTPAPTHTSEPVPTPTPVPPTNTPPPETPVVPPPPDDTPGI
ncbi:MAG: VanW family protein [Oscillospiraceae bacterium]|jgi:vancomycin resistance protein YoaR|nr:VanW family protein [Oscillospiraceae bacterium]